MRRYIIVILFILIVVSSATAYYYYSRFSEVANTISPQPAQNTNEVQDLVAKVGNLMVLPTDEIPTVATVADLAQLKGQPFFANARKGDKVLIYGVARKAILYDPVANKIVEIAPVDINSPAIQGGVTQTPSAVSAKTPVATSTIKKRNKR